MIRNKHFCKLPERGGFRIPCPCLFLFCAALALTVDDTGLLRIGLLCALLHECGHIAAYLIFVGRWPVIEVTPLGLCMRMRGIWLSPRQELMLAAAGPLVNLSLCSIAILLMDGPFGYSYRGYWFATVNLLVGCTNLLPLPGLDGARILHCLGEGARSGLHSRRK